MILKLKRDHSNNRKRYFCLLQTIITTNQLQIFTDKNGILKNWMVEFNRTEIKYIRFRIKIVYLHNLLILILITGNLLKTLLKPAEHMCLKMSTAVIINCSIMSIKKSILSCLHKIRRNLY